MESPQENSDSQSPERPNQVSRDRDPTAPKDESSASWESVHSHLLYGLSIPERALRATSGAVGGAVRESASLLVPQAFQNSQTYSTLVRQTLDFLVEDVGRVAKSGDAAETGDVENFVARKTVGGFVDMAGVATFHVSPMLLLAIVSDVAYGSQAYLNEMADELKREGVIDENATIQHASDLLNAVGATSQVASDALDAPPLSLEGLSETINQVTSTAAQIDPISVLPQTEIQQMWDEMHQIASQEGVSMMEVSSAMTLHALGKVGTAGRGSLSSVRAAGTMLDRHVVDHYRNALNDIQQQGYYRTLAETSGPYIEAVWRNFSDTHETWTEDLLTGRMVSRGASAVRKWLGGQSNT